MSARTSRLPWLLLAVLAFLVLPVAATSRAAEDPKPADAPEQAWLDQLESNLKDVKSTRTETREAAEVKIVEAIDQLLTSFKSLPEPKQKEVAGAVTRVFSVRTVDDANKVYAAAAAALSDMGPEGEAGLLKGMKTPYLEKRGDVQAYFIEALGKHRNEKHVELFIKTLLKDDTRMVVAAAKSLSEYREADGKLRKKISEALVREYAKAYAADVAGKGKDAPAHQRLIDIETTMNSTLEMLTLQRFQSAPEWEKWFNDNRNKSW